MINNESKGPLENINEQETYSQDTQLFYKIHVIDVLCDILIYKNRRRVVIYAHPD